MMIVSKVIPARLWMITSQAMAWPRTESPGSRWAENGRRKMSLLTIDVNPLERTMNSLGSMASVVDMRNGHGESSSHAAHVKVSTSLRFSGGCLAINSMMMTSISRRQSC